MEKGFNFCHCFYWREPWRRQVLYMGRFQHTGNIFSNYQSLLQTHNGIRPRNPNSRHCAYSEEDLSFKDPLKVALRGDRIEIGRDR